MVDALAGTVFVCLILLGTVAFCYIIMLKLLIPKTDGDYYILIPCDKNTKDVRKKAYGMRLKLNLFSDGIYGKIVVLDSGITEEERESLLEICKESNGIYLVPGEKIKDFLNGRI